MLYQLSTQFTLLNQKSGVLENQSTYATLEYTTAAEGEIPPLGSGIRIEPGGMFRFSLPERVNGFVRFLFVRTGDYTRSIAVVEDAGSGMHASDVKSGLSGVEDAIRQHQCNVTVNVDCCKCCCNHDKPNPPDPPDEKEGVDLIVSNQPQPDENILWGDPSNEPEASTGSAVDGGSVVIGNISSSGASPTDQDLIWGDTN